MRRSLLAAVSASAIALSVAPGAAIADDEIDDERTEQQRTSDAGEGGGPDNIVITSNGRVVLETAGPAVVMDSDNDVTIESGGEISIDDVDGAVGVEIQGGSEGDFTHAGTIALLEDYTPSDSGTDDLADRDGDGDADDPDREADGEFSQDADKTGVLVSGTDVFLGNIVTESGSLIRVYGDTSYGVRVQAPVEGDLSFGGNVDMRGDDSRAVSVENEVTGDVTVAGRITMASPGGSAVAIEGDVNGSTLFGGNILNTGYRISNRSFASVFQTLDQDDDDLSGGAAVLIEGSLRDGVFILGAAEDGSQSGARIRQAGDAPGFLVRPDEAASENMTIGRAVVPAGFDADRSEDEDEALDHAIVNEGAIDADGVFDGRDATAVLIAGRDVSGTLRAVVLEGGFLNAGAIRSDAYDGDAVALRFGEGAQAAEVRNTNLIGARGLRGFEEDGFADDAFETATATAIVIDAGAEIGDLINEGRIASELVNRGSAATAIKVSGESLQRIENSGEISAGVTNALDGALEAATLIAIDASGMTGGLTVRQFDADPDDENAPVIDGDVLFGSGDDVLRLEAGSINGDVFFGDGADTLFLRGANLTGEIGDSDGRLTIDAEDATLAISTGEQLSITSARFGEGATLDLIVDGADRDTAFLTASDTVSFEAGSELQVSLSELIGENGVFSLIDAGALAFDDEEAILETTGAPYLYEATIERDPNDAGALRLTLRRKDAGELGMNANQAGTYSDTLAMFDEVEALGAAFAAIRTREDFFSAYDQLLPEYSASAIQFAIAANDAAQGALAARLRNARMAPDELAGLWVQEFGYFADRSETAFGPGYRGEGVGLAIGLDQPMGPFYAVGVNLAAAASEVEEINGFDEPMVSITGQVGAYAAMDMGGIDISTSLALGYDSFESERRILIGDFSAVNTADWSGWHVAASASAGRDFTLGKWVVRPEAALSYLALFESGYEEEAIEGAEELALIVDDRESTAITAAATLEVARRFGTDISWWLPHARIGYRGDFSDGENETTARFNGPGDSFTLRSTELSGSGVLAGFGLSAGSNYSTFTFAYDADIREDFIRHVARLVIRLTF